MQNGTNYIRNIRIIGNFNLCIASRADEPIII